MLLVRSFVLVDGSLVNGVRIVNYDRLGFDKYSRYIGEVSILVSLFEVVVYVKSKLY